MRSSPEARPTLPPPSLFIRAASGCLRLQGGRVWTNEGAASAERAVLLPGDRLLPGLINGHDHLHRNSLPRVQYRARHRNIADWIADLDERRALDPVLRADAGRPRVQRLWHGAIKNLLSGVTTVVHHDRPDPALADPCFPLHVLSHPAWRNALGLDGEAALLRSHRDTPAPALWMVHAAEGIDAEAEAEFDVLDRLGCVTPNTRLIHGVGLTSSQRDRLVARGAALVWCPSSNLHLFGRTADVGRLMAQGRVALGTDSRASGVRDLLAELSLARELQALDDTQAQALVTARAAALLGLPDRGHLGAGAHADLIALPADLPLSRAVRADLRLVMRGGQVLLADPDVAEAFGAAADLEPVRVDGRPKRLSRSIARRLREWGVQEGGLVLDAVVPDDEVIG